MSSILDSKALDSGFHEQNFTYKKKFSRFRNPDTPYMGRNTKHFVTCPRIFNQPVGNLL